MIRLKCNDYGFKTIAMYDGFLFSMIYGIINNSTSTLIKPETKHNEKELSTSTSAITLNDQRISH